MTEKPPKQKLLQNKQGENGFELGVSTINLPISRQSLMKATGINPILQAKISFE